MEKDATILTIDNSVIYIYGYIIILQSTKSQFINALINVWIKKGINKSMLKYI